MTQAFVFSVIFITGYSIVILLHGVGLCMLRRVKTNLPNQKVLVTNLALAEFILSFYMTVNYSVDICGGWNATWNYVDIFMICFSYTTIRLLVLHIILDRFAEIYLNIRYALYMHIKRTKLIVAAIWTFSLTLAVIMTIIFHYSSAAQIWRIDDTTILIFDSLILVSVISTYSYLFVKVKKIKVEDLKANQQATSRRRVLVWDKFKIPTLTVITYVVFDISGTVVSTIGSFGAFDEESNQLLQDISYVLDIPAFITDACIYMFLQKEVRKKLSQIISDSFFSG